MELGSPGLRIDFEGIALLSLRPWGYCHFTGVCAIRGDAQRPTAADWIHPNRIESNELIGSLRLFGTRIASAVPHRPDCGWTAPSSAAQKKS